MSPEWDSIPLLPLRCILDHLNLEDAMAAMSTCRHWRSAVLLYEGRKDTLKLKAKQLDKCMYLTRLFRKYAKRLHIYIDCNNEELDKFMSYVLPQYFDTVKLHELIFIGPSFLQQSIHIPVVKLKRIIVESLIFKHSHTLQKVGLMGCEISVLSNENDRFIHKNLEYYSRSLKFNYNHSPSDIILSRSNIGLMVFSTIQHMILDYEIINTAALETLSALPAFSRLTLNVGYKRQMLFHTIDWDRVDDSFPNGLEVSVNIVALPLKKFDEVIENVLREGMALTSLKVMFCKSLYKPLLEHVARVFPQTLQELVWADGPHDVITPCIRKTLDDVCSVNPFVLLCWQCTQLRRLVIHGYWVWQYDLLGFVRLRSSLWELEVSALYRRRAPNGSSRVTTAAPPRMTGTTAAGFVQEINEYTEFNWKPTPWDKLHPGLRSWATPVQRADYVLQEALQPLGVT